MKLQFDLSTALVHMELITKGRGDEFEDILAILMDHATVQDDETLRLARFIAFSSLLENHLWQDMGLENRAELTDIMRTYFVPMFEKNTHDMKWKKFFYKQICVREGFTLCKSPSCGECIDYGKCFGPEDGPAAKA